MNGKERLMALAMGIIMAISFVQLDPLETEAQGPGDVFIVWFGPKDIPYNLVTVEFEVILFNGITTEFKDVLVKISFLHICEVASCTSDGDVDHVVVDLEASARTYISLEWKPSLTGEYEVTIEIPTFEVIVSDRFTVSDSDLLILVPPTPFPQGFPVGTKGDLEFVLINPLNRTHSYGYFSSSIKDMQDRLVTGPVESAWTILGPYQNMTHTVNISIPDVPGRYLLEVNCPFCTVHTRSLQFVAYAPNVPMLDVRVKDVRGWNQTVGDDLSAVNVTVNIEVINIGGCAVEDLTIRLLDRRGRLRAISILSHLGLVQTSNMRLYLQMKESSRSLFKATYEGWSDSGMVQGNVSDDIVIDLKEVDMHIIDEAGCFCYSTGFVLLVILMYMVEYRDQKDLKPVFPSWYELLKQRMKEAKEKGKKENKGYRK